MAGELKMPPMVTIVMPVRNEGRAIRHSLDAALGQVYPAELLEVIVVDGMSQDETRHIVAQVAASDSRVRLVENQRRIMAAGFNTALEHARGEVIVMMGGHSEMSPDFVRVCVEALAESRAECVGGTLETLSSNVVGRAIAAAMSSPFGVGDSAFRIGVKERKSIDTVAFGAYRREAFTLAGRLDEELVRCQDCEFNHRLRKLGAEILFVPDLRCRYFGRDSLVALWRQYFSYGWWKVRVMQKHPRQMRPRHFMPAAFALVVLLSATTAPFALLSAAVLTATAGTYAVASFFASLRAARKHAWRLLPLLPIIFAILHFAYGLGFLCGLIKFRNRWGERAAQFAAQQVPDAK